jgi:hypothetical protein
MSVLSPVPLFAIFLFCQRFPIRSIAMSYLKRQRTS